MTKLYHGGTRRLHKGGIVLPPVRSGAATTADYGAAAVCRRDRVYVVDDLDTARFFALLAAPRGNGSVYEVEPIGALEPDPDYKGDGQSLQVPMARVVRVLERRVMEWHGLSRDEALAAMATLDEDLRI